MSAWWWWVTLPRTLARRFVGLSAIAVDGHVLMGLGPLAALLPPLALAGGFYAGVAHPGFEVTFTESLALMLTLLAIGTVSTQLGALTVIGFAVGDFFFEHTNWSTEPSFFGDEPSGLLSNPLIANLVVERVPLLIQYALMAALAVGVPVGARSLAGSLAVRLRLPDGVHFVVTAVLVAVTSFVLARLWASAAPMVIRPVFTWTIDDGINQGNMPVGAIEPIQGNVHWIARVGALAVLGRMALTWLFGRSRRVTEAETAILAPIDGPEKAEAGVVRTLLQAALIAGVAVLFLAGMIDDWWAAGVLAAAFFVARLARSGLIPIPTRRWREVVNRIPIIVRFGGTLLVMNGVAKAVIASSLNTGDDRFQFLVWPVAGAALLMAFAMPDPPRRLPGAAAVVIGAFLLILAGTAEPAAADNCQTFTDCFSTADAASDALLGLTFLGMLSLALNFVPVVGTAKGVLESLTGRDLLTGEQLSMTDRLLGLIPGGLGRLGRFGRFGARADDMADLGRGTRASSVPSRARPGDVPTPPRTSAGGRGGKPPPPPPRGGPAPPPPPPRRPPHGSTPDRRGPWGDNRSRVQEWRERWWGDQRPARTANGEDSTVPSRNPSVDHEPGGTPARIDPENTPEGRRNLDLENRNARTLEEHGFRTNQNPTHGPDGRPATADYEVEGRLFDHKVARTDNVRNFVDGNLEKGANSYLNKGTQANRFVVDLRHSGITPEQLRAELLSRPGTNVQEVFVIHNGDVIPIYP